ncbi:hypothetical protein HYH03_013736 [Edaphochlamys debaryana]|uniref:Protein kinase domain-containing protein n=1 Tax=Edaphochlamys debaryana TaxID=47281 RepID=A0A836BUA2_9CHLO|nr:hypothetical protein HYH03_013736 [Edaphochlamys debaryana]|eukprot:KAG2487738.1 hypothetical protein HYH03_013736 [Edaphochlamys debaryana]
MLKCAAVLVLCLCVLAGAQHQARTSAELVRALQAASVARSTTEILVEVDLVVSNADFEGGVTPIQLWSEVVIRSVSGWPLVSLQAQKKIMLRNGATLRFRHVVVETPQGDSALRAPSFQILAPAPNGEMGTLALGPQAAQLGAVCFPADLQAFSVANTARAPADGKPQNYTVPYPWTNCTNSSTAPYISRCYPLVSLAQDITFAGLTNAVLASPGTLLPTNYNWAVTDTYFLCRVVVPSDCIAREQPITCMLATIRGLNGNLSGLAAPPAVPGGSLRVESTPGERAGISSGAQAGIIAGTVVGGVFVLLCGVLLVVWRQRRRAPQALALTGSKDQDSAEPRSTHDVDPACEAPVDVDAEQPAALAAAIVSPQRASSVLGCGVLSPITRQTPHHPGLDLSVLVHTPRGAHGSASDGFGGTPRAPASDSGHLNHVSADPSQSGGVATTRAPSLLSPPAEPDVNADGSADAGGGSQRLTLLGVCLGKGACGRVVEGLYQGQRVAVKLLDTGLVMLARSTSPERRAVAGGRGGDGARGGGDGGGGGSEGQGLRHMASTHEQLDEAVETEGVAAAEDGAEEGGDVGGGGLVPAFTPSGIMWSQHLSTHDNVNQQESASALEATAGVTRDTAAPAAGDAEAESPASALLRTAAAVTFGGAQVAVAPLKVQGLLSTQDGAPRHLRMTDLFAPSDESGDKGLKGLAECLAQEVEVLSRIHHSNCVKLLAANLGPPQPCLVMELMDTSLDRMLYGSGGPPVLLLLDKVLHIALQIAQALAYLHPTIIHRGLSRLQETVLVTARVTVGTAPECLNALNCVISHHADMYGFAVLVYEMLAGVRPWEGANIVQIAHAVDGQRRRPPLDELPPGRCPRALRSLIQACWDQVPERRPAACEVAKELMLIRQKAQLLHAALERAGSG